MSQGSIDTRFIMFLAASTDIVIVSSSGEGTDLLKMSKPLLIISPSVPQTLPISWGVILYFGT
jgi:hypothetical protein